jgi:UDP-N-acetylglucosamine 4-epimerase
MEEQVHHHGDITALQLLITGGAGFIGSNLADYFLKHQAKKVLVIDNLSTGNLNNIQRLEKYGNFEFREGDVADLAVCEKAVEGMDYISHQAALGSVPRSIKDPLATNQANVTGFLNLLTAAKDSQVKRLVYASSSSVYGDSLSLPKKEEEIGSPLSPYAVSKLTDELYAGVFQQTYGLETVGLRYFNVFGPHQSPEGAYAAVIPLFIKAILNNEEVNVHGDGLQSRDFTFIDNAVEANVKALFADKQATAKVYNVAVGESHTLMELIQVIEEESGKKAHVNHSSSREGDIRNSLADISRAAQFLQYQPQVKLREGLAKTIAWFKQ